MGSQKGAVMVPVGSPGPELFTGDPLTPRGRRRAPPSRVSGSTARRPLYLHIPQMRSQRRDAAPTPCCLHLASCAVF